MHALLTTQGTAMAETALCSDHLTQPDLRDAAISAAAAAGDWNGDTAFTNCDGNDALTCLVGCLPA